MPKFIKQVGGVLTEEATTATSAGAGDSGKVPELDGGGKLDASMLPANVGAETVDLTATVALAAGEWVNIYDNAGTPEARLADATDISTEVSGFVLSSVILGGTATVYLEGTNDQLTGLTAGVKYFLSETAGAETVTPPSTSAAIVQNLGKTLNATSISFEPSNPIVLA